MEKINNKLIYNFADFLLVITGNMHRNVMLTNILVHYV